MTRYIVKILRYNPQKDNCPYLETFKLDIEPAVSILDCLNQIKWQIDGTLSFRRSCRSGICGSCAVNINGKNMLACETQIQDLKKRTIVIKPLAAFTVLRDLVVDFDEFFQAIESIKPYIINKNQAADTQETRQTAQQRAKLDGLYECILCGACTSACPSFRYNPRYSGPAALLKAYRYSTDSRDNAKEERLKLADNPDGVWQCHTIFNCVEACPKNLCPPEAIEQMKRDIIKKNFL